jgi:Flp pilus assembly protein TadG
MLYSGHMKLKRQRGLESVELALIFPLVLLLVFSIIYFGWLLNNYLLLNAAALLGARQLASERGYSTPYTDTVYVIKGSVPTLLGFSTSNITLTAAGVACTSDAACTGLGTATSPPASGSQAVVSLSYTFVPPMLIGIEGFSNLSISLTATQSELIE